MRPCTCDRARKGEPHTPDQCTLCWLFWNNSLYRQLWQGPSESQAVPPASPVLSDCPHFGADTGHTVRCPSCRGHVEVKLFHCAVYGECTPTKVVPGVACCRQEGGCPGRQSAAGEKLAVKHRNNPQRPREGFRWAVGVTTVPSRRDNLLPQTLASLRQAGFAKPRLFVDGCANREASWWEDQFGCEVTVRSPRIRTFGNWIMGLVELYIRQPQADRYFMAQDDAIFVSNLRDYLESCLYPDGQDERPKGYWNCLTFPQNQAVAPRNEYGGTLEGWFPAQRKHRGLGAVALVFNREAVIRLFTHYEHIIDRPLTAGRLAYEKIDGGIVDALNKQGWSEFCHSPSLCRHAGNERSAMGHQPYPLDVSFPGESFDARRLIVG